MSKSVKRIEETQAQAIETTTNNNHVTPMTLVQMAIDQNADVDKLARLYELQVAWEKNQAKKAYDAAMAAFRAEAPAIKKTRKAHNSLYAGLAETLQAIQPIMAKHGLSHSWRTEQNPGSITVTCIVTHVDGHSEQTSMFGAPDTSGSKNNIQAIGSTITYLQRYTLYSILGLASTDQDDDGAGGAAEDDLNKRRRAVWSKLRESFSGDSEQIVQWLEANGFGSVKNATEDELSAIEEKLG